MLRNPILVARDVATRKVSVRVANEVYGVALAADGTVDTAGTDDLRGRLRRSRAGLSAIAA